jgi:hypothetical protein
MPSRFPRIAIQEIGDKQGDVFSSVPQRGHLDGKDVEPIIQIAPKGTRSDSSLQIAIGSGHDPNVGWDGSGSSDALEFAFLKNPQKSDLSFGRKLANFIEEESAFLCQLKAS